MDANDAEVLPRKANATVIVLITLGLNRTEQSAQWWWSLYAQTPFVQEAHKEQVVLTRFGQNSERTAQCRTREQLVSASVSFLL